MQYDNKSFQAELVSVDSIWFVGPAGSGKTTRLIEQLQRWAGVQSREFSQRLGQESRGQEKDGQEKDGQEGQPCLVFAASGNNRLSLVERISETLPERYPFDSVTPISFFQNEVVQFWPLLKQKLDLSPQTLLRLHPETEYELAARLWRPELESGQLRQAGVQDAVIVQRTLDLFRLAAASGTPHEQIPLILEQGLTEQAGSPQLWKSMAKAVKRWWHWCLERGLLTYPIITELYWRYLLPDRNYQQQLKRRYRAVLADDVDEYPAAARALFEFFLDQGTAVAFSFNPHGGIRLGLGADPDYWAGLAQRCRVELLQPPDHLGNGWGQVMVEAIRNPLSMPQLPDSMPLIQTVTKAQLLRQTAETITTAIQAGEVQPQDIAIIAPGLDAITRYTLQEILGSKGISLVSLNLQQPLIRSPLVRALLTLLALIYPHLGRLVDRESVAEMLVILSQVEQRPVPSSEHSPDPSFTITVPAPLAPLKPRIDPVRAGLLADHCFVPDPLTPRLLPVVSFPRWDRLGYQASEAYGEILQWLDQQRQPTVSPAVMLERAIQRFLNGELTYDQLTLLQEFMEAAQHYWEVETRLAQFNRTEVSAAATAGRLIQLLREGTITGNPPAVASKAKPAVTLATIYQYRNERCSHRWQFWLDAGSAFWLTGRASLFAAPLFLRQRLNRVWTATDEFTANQNYLEQEILDLLSRAKERVYLCHCDLAVNGQEQSGALMPIVNAAVPVN